MTQHGFRHTEVRDHAILQRTDRRDAARRSAEHALRVIADGHHFVGAGLHRHHRGLSQNDAVIFNINEGVSRAEIDTDVLGHKTKKSAEHEMKMGKGLRKKTKKGLP